MLNDNEATEVLLAIASALREGAVTTFVPHNYRAAIQDLADARVDRTAGRKAKWDAAEKRLQPVLDAADSRSALSMRKRALGIDSLMITWRRLCAGGPAVLPVPEDHEDFEHKYVARGGETIADVARGFGFTDPCPLKHYPYDYPPNMRLTEKDTIFIPYTPAHLQQLIQAAERLINKTMDSLREVLTEINAQQEDVERYVITLEAIAIVANIGAALAHGAHITAQALQTTDMLVEAEKSHEMLHWLAHEGGKTNVELFHFAVETSHTHRKDLALLVRHGLGFLSPTWWGSLLYAGGSSLFGSKEPLAWLNWVRGPEGVAEHRAEELKRQTDRRIDDFRGRVQIMQSQLESPIYKCLPCGTGKPQKEKAQPRSVAR